MNVLSGHNSVYIIDVHLQLMRFVHKDDGNLLLWCLGLLLLALALALPRFAVLSVELLSLLAPRREHARAPGRSIVL